MGTHADNLFKEFIIKKEFLTIECSSVDAADKWDIETYGDINMYCDNLFFTVMLRMIASDGVFSDEETNVLRNMFEIECSDEYIEHICDNMHMYESNTAFLKRIKEELLLIDTVSHKASAYLRELIELACKIVIDSDYVASDEVALSKSILDALTF